MKGLLAVIRTTGIVLLSLGASSAAIAQDVGAISGTVTDSTGAVLPGVTVVLSNPGTIGGNQQAVTDERGVYQFTKLVPSGTYSVRAELEGFRAIVRDRIVVNAAVTVRADLKLDVGSMSDAITVSGQVPLLDTTSTFSQTVLYHATLHPLPTINTICTTTPIVP